VVTGAFLGDRTTQLTFAGSSWRAHMFRADFQNSIELSLVVPTSLWWSSIKAFENSILEVQLSGHQ